MTSDFLTLAPLFGQLFVNQTRVPLFFFLLLLGILAITVKRSIFLLLFERNCVGRKKKYLRDFGTLCGQLFTYGSLMHVLATQCDLSHLDRFCFFGFTIVLPLVLGLRMRRCGSGHLADLGW